MEAHNPCAIKAAPRRPLAFNSGNTAHGWRPIARRSRICLDLPDNGRKNGCDKDAPLRSDYFQAVLSGRQTACARGRRQALAQGHAGPHQSMTRHPVGMHQQEAGVRTLRATAATYGRRRGAATAQAQRTARGQRRRDSYQLMTCPRSVMRRLPAPPKHKGPRFAAMPVWPRF